MRSDINFFRNHPGVELIEENQVFTTSTYKTANCQRQDGAIWARHNHAQHTNAQEQKCSLLVLLDEYRICRGSTPTPSLAWAATTPTTRRPATSTLTSLTRTRLYLFLRTTPPHPHTRSSHLPLLLWYTSGILTTHQEFQGRAIWGANFADSMDTDCNGHGTHVAGTVGGRTVGIARGVTVIAVKWRISQR